MRRQPQSFANAPLFSCLPLFSDASSVLCIARQQHGRTSAIAVHSCLSCLGGLGRACLLMVCYWKCVTAGTVISQTRVVCVAQGGLWRLTGQQIAGAAAEGEGGGASSSSKGAAGGGEGADDVRGPHASLAVKLQVSSPCLICMLWSLDMHVCGSHCCSPGSQQHWQYAYGSAVCVGLKQCRLDLCTQNLVCLPPFYTTCICFIKNHRSYCTQL